MKARALAPEATAQLRELAMEIQDQFTLCEQEWRTTVEYAQGMLEHARAIGEKLLAAKKLAGHGHWKSWVAANLRFSIDKTERLMRLHKNWDRIKSAPEPILGIKEAIAYLAAPKKQAKQETAKGEKRGAGDTVSRRVVSPVSGDAVVAQPDDHLASTCTVQVTYPDSEYSEFDKDGICVLVGDASEGEDVTEADAAVEDDGGQQSAYDCYLDPAEADFFSPTEPFDEATADRLDALLDNMKWPLSQMLAHEAVAALSEFDPLKVGLLGLERALQQVSNDLARRRPTACVA